MLGVSIYLGNDHQDDVQTYLRKVRTAGFTAIFTSLHIPEDNPFLYKERLLNLGAVAKENQMEVMADISPKSLGHLGCTLENAEELLNWGITGLRVDYGISETAIISLSKKMKIALNASTIKKGSLDRLKQGGLQIESVEAWHNFYPRPETGLDKEEFTAVNKWLKDEGLTVMAFIPGDSSLRGPLYNKLPTLECHRNSSPLNAYIDLVTCCFVDKVFVGDLDLSKEALVQFEHYRQGVFTLRAQQVSDDTSLLSIIEAVQTNRLDAARDCIRSIESRSYGLFGTRPVSPCNTISRPIGTITIDNEKYGRYQGEIQITKRNLPADEKVNVIGRVIECDRGLLKYLHGGKKFRVKWV